MIDMYFKKEDVLDALRENREKHMAIVREAQVGYRKKMIALLESLLELAKSGAQVEPQIDLRLPSNHVGDYDQAIAMLELTTDENVKLGPEAFQCYVQGLWHWRREFLVSNSAYSDAAVEASRGI